MRWFASLLWSLVNAVVRVAVRPSAVLPVPVISVGNIEAGGTGKTPWVKALARELAQLGKVPVILSRGYGGAIAREGKEEILAPLSSTPGAARVIDPAHWGDEIAELALSLPEAWFGVGADRLRTWGAVRAQLPAEALQRVVVILDDGLQQFRLARQLDLVLVTSRTPGQVVFRELFFGIGNRASRVRAWIWTKGDRKPWLWTSRASQSRWKVPLVACASSPLKGRKVFLVCGVGFPDFVEQSLSELGAEVVGSVHRPDHAIYAPQEILQYCKDAERHQAVLVTTAKDAVKWRSVWEGREFPWTSVELFPESEGFQAVRTRLLDVLQVE